MLKSKKIITFFLILLFLILIIVGWYDIKNGRYSIFGNYIPNNFKTFLKNTIFIVPNLQKLLANKNAEILELSIEKIKTLETWNTISTNNTKIITAKKILTKTININNEEVILRKFLLPLPDYYTWGQKSVGYIEEIKNNFLFVAGDGTIFFFSGNGISKNLINKNNKLELFKISSNLSSLTNNELIKVGKISIKDILIKNNKIYISHINTKKEGCHNIEIISGKVNFEYISFSNFFTYNECFKNGNVHSTGGRMVNFSNNEILFTIGEGLNRRLAQNINSFFGKILKINTETQEYKIISMGHRNPQGLFYDKKNNIVTSTEHGPAGGDEINIIKFSDKITNYGWPISSYGNHYQGQIDKYKNKGKLDELLTEAPLHKSHSKHSFEEPINYFTSSIGISEIIKLPENLDTSLKDYYLVAAMGKNIDEGGKSLYYFKLNQNKNKIEKIDKVVIGERIRDLKFSKENNLIIMVLENTPSIGFISLYNQ